MKWGELRRIDESKGWYLARHGANHDIYRHDGISELLLIERHESQEIRNGLYLKNRKLIGF